jgi:lipopolysaccharide export LptBFGC system permease protein LptF
MCYPALGMAAALTAATLPLNNWLIPVCRAEKRKAIKEAFMREPFRISLIGGHVTLELGDHKIYVERVEGDVLHDVVVVAPRTPKEPEQPAKGADRHKFAEQHNEVYVYRARRARYSADPDNSLVRIVLEDAEYTIVTPDRNARSWLNLTAAEQALEIPVESPVEDIRDLRRTYLVRSELLARAREIRERMAASPAAKELNDLRGRLARTLTELRLREALSASTFVLALVGVPLGVWIRRESRLASFAVAVLVFLLLFAFIAGAEGLAVKGRVAPALALWAPDALAGGLGVGMLVRLFRR